MYWCYPLVSTRETRLRQKSLQGTWCQCSPSCYINICGCWKEKQNPKYSEWAGERNGSRRGRIAISVSQWAVSGPPTPSFVRLNCYSSPSYSWVWSGGWWVEGEQSRATPPPSTALEGPRFIAPLPGYTHSLSVQRPPVPWLGPLWRLPHWLWFLTDVMCLCQRRHPDAWPFVASSSSTIFKWPLLPWGWTGWTLLPHRQGTLEGCNYFSISHPRVGFGSFEETVGLVTLLL